MGIIVIVVKRFLFDFFKGRLLVIFIIVVHLLLFLFSRLWRFTGSRSDVLWPQLANQQQRVSFLQREHHFWSNAYCLRAQVLFWTFYCHSVFLRFPLLSQFFLLPAFPPFFSFLPSISSHMLPIDCMA